ncbi:MAG: single-stranded-DNA-specific exonuclease RecJ [Lachnospiraceae bacterium]|nr:single-stranded-DNA-specific exonuclease RecJ [Lachnospiraceae bacterium]
MKQEKWYVAAKKADFEGIGRQFSIDPLTARMIRNRDIEGEDAIRKYLYGTLDDLYPPEAMKGIPEAVSLLLEKIKTGARIRVIGDYDIDGIMATYILWEGLKLLGASVDTVIPHRIQDGYGLNEGLIRVAHEDGIDTIVTCDNGIAAYSQIKYANDLGMTVIVTDHHEVPYDEESGERVYQIPPAAVVVDPKQPDCKYPFSGICGAVVAMKLVQALFEVYGMGGRKALDIFLEMAAFATVGDVMELVDENRIIVKYGLQALEHSGNPGLCALTEVCELTDRHLSAYHIGFVLGPCLNATGRLDTAKRALSLLQCGTRQEALPIATDLKHLNESRKEMTLKGVEAAQALIKEQGLDGRKVLILYLPDCHESLAGIIAGRIREEYERPVFVLTDSEDGVKGSGRSIEAYSMYEEMSKCKDLFIRYGGHKMAAGLTLPKENVQLFAQRMEQECALTEEDFAVKVHIDAAMPFGYVNEALLSQFSLLEPFGNGNRKPLFAQRNVALLGSRILGKTGRVGKYTVLDENNRCYELTYFGEQEQLLSYWEKKGKINVTYYAEQNTYRGRTQIQFIVQSFQ